MKEHIQDLKQFLPGDGLIKDLHSYITGLQWEKLEFSKNKSIFSPEGICKSGIAGLLELRFSDSIFPQTTHFGIVYPGLVLAYGDDWHSDGKLATGLGAVAAFETVYWWMDYGKENHCPEHS